MRGCALRFPARVPGPMKRPVLGTLSILALLGGGIYLAVQYKDDAQSPRTADACYEGAAARSKFMEQFDFALPASADEVRLCVEYVERTQLSYARFDVPAAELIALFPDPNIPSAVAAQGTPGGWSGGNNYQFQASVPDDVMRIISALGIRSTTCSASSTSPGVGAP